MIHLTPEQHQELSSSGSLPVHALDPATKNEYVLVPLEVYQQWRGLADDGANTAETYSAVDRTFAKGWDDPTMDDYDRYEELRK